MLREPTSQATSARLSNKQAWLRITSGVIAVFMGSISSPQLVSATTPPAQTPALTVFTIQQDAIELVGQREVQRGDLVQIRGSGLLGVAKVFVDGIEASYSKLSDTGLQFTVPFAVKPGDAGVTLKGSFGEIELTSFITVSAIDLAISSKITVGSFNSFVAIYTKNLEGKRLSFKVGNRWRVVSAIPSTYTMNLVKVGRGKNLETKVYIDRQLVKISKLIVR